MDIELQNRAIKSDTTVVREKVLSGKYDATGQIKKAKSPVLYDYNQPYFVFEHKF